jgi:A/G-specific adenine glycosylase
VLTGVVPVGMRMDEIPGLGDHPHLYLRRHCTNTSVRVRLSRRKIQPQKMSTAAARPRRRAALAAVRNISASILRDAADASEQGSPDRAAGTARREPARRARKLADGDVESSVLESEADEDDAIAPRAPKRRRTATPRGKNDASTLHRILFGSATSAPPAQPTCEDFSRRHTVSYHRPLLLDGYRGARARESLFKWFDSVSADRGMPWRKPWIDPDASDPTALRAALERRAYEVWISEIMLQQTRVAVVIDYWNKWMARWPTIQELASASTEDVLQAWRGLGYYSRATRIHDAAKLIVGDAEMQGLLPSDPVVLEAKVPGVGRYTAGAISSIVYGEPAAMVDGNVLRVLSRQLGILADVKTGKAVIDVLWGAADALVKAVAKGPGGKTTSSDRPGRWGQALMELGSTICTPTPNCAACPIHTTCRAFLEGISMREERSDQVVPIEDLCTLCEPLESFGEEGNGDSETRGSGRKRGPKGKSDAKLGEDSEYFQHSKLLRSQASRHASCFPLKRAKKPVREQETIVCAIRRSDGKFLIRRRPDKGLLAGLWELPSRDLPLTADKSTAEARTLRAVAHVSQSLVAAGVAKKQPGTARAKHVRDLGLVPWEFSHLKLRMHVHGFTVETETYVEAVNGDVSADGQWKWLHGEEVDKEAIGTGMRKCWELVKAGILASGA